MARTDLIRLKEFCELIGKLCKVQARRPDLYDVCEGCPARNFCERSPGRWSFEGLEYFFKALDILDDFGLLDLPEQPPEQSDTEAERQT